MESATQSNADIGDIGAPANTDGGSWRKALVPYSQPSLPRSIVFLFTSLVPYLALVAAMYALYDVSYWYVAALTPLAAGFLVRTYIVFHDCGHGSFMPSTRANKVLGGITGVFVYTPFEHWRHSHAVHHATAGDLERRGTGDVPTMTVDEYFSRPFKGRIGYRLFRTPAIMFGIGPIWAMLIGPRFISKDERLRNRQSVWKTNVGLAVLVGLQCIFFGPLTFLAVVLPSALLAGSAGIWLFYVQHQFEDVYWQNSDEWSYDAAALQGSSYLKLPKVFQFFSGNIGLHHVHHLSVRVPNYNLQRAHDDNPIFHRVPTLTMWDGIKCTRLKLYDERAGRMVGWREGRASYAAAHATATPVVAPISAG